MQDDGCVAKSMQAKGAQSYSLYSPSNGPFQLILASYASKLMDFLSIIQLSFIVLTMNSRDHYEIIGLCKNVTLYKTTL